MTTNEPLHCSTVKDQIAMFLSDSLENDVVALMNSHFARCESCHTLFMSEMATGIFHAQVQFRKSERLEKRQESSSLPKPFISAFPTGLREIQFAMPLAASAGAKKMYKFEANEFTLTVWKKGSSATIIALNIEDKYRSEYEGVRVEIRSNDKQILLLNKKIHNGQTSDNTPYAFSEVEKMLPPRLSILE